MCTRGGLGRLSVDSRPINVYISGDALVDCQSNIGRLSTNSRSIVDQYIGRLSAYMSTEATYSTHDPNFLLNFNFFRTAFLSLFHAEHQ